MSTFLKITGYASAALFGVLLLAVLVLSLPQSGWRALSVQTGSMVPAFDPGALVLVHKVPVDSLRVGDIITYNSQTAAGKSITHRVVGFQQAGRERLVIVKGDANAVADAPVAASQIVGKEIRSVPKLGHVIDFMRSPGGLILVIYIPALMLIIYELKRMIERLAQLELDKRHAAARAAAQKIYHGIKPTSQARSRYLGKGLGVLVLLIALSSAVPTTYSQLTSNTAKLTGITITTKTTAPPSSSCSSNNSVTASNNSQQTASSGSASSSNNSSSGSASSGNASNSNSTSVNVNITGC